MHSILDDKLLALRLAEQPEFHLRLSEFLDSYGVAERAALTIQARPVHAGVLAAVNVDDAEVQKRFLAGMATNDSWWQGFRSMVSARPRFHGIGGLPTREKPTWASELHRDGHVIAGIWEFPDLEIGGTPVKVMSDFYADMFTDFLGLIESTLGPRDEQPIYQTTWTLTHAPQLHFANKSSWGRFGVSAAPLRISHLQWPISSAKVGSSKWKQLATCMGQALVGAYGEGIRS